MNKNEDKTKKKQDVIPPFSTYALSDKEKTLPESHATIPSEQAVKEAKDWVDENEK